MENSPEKIEEDELAWTESPKLSPNFALLRQMDMDTTEDSSPIGHRLNPVGNKVFDLANLTSWDGTICGLKSPALVSAIDKNRAPLDVDTWLLTCLDAPNLVEISNAKTIPVKNLLESFDKVDSPSGRDNDDNNEDVSYNEATLKSKDLPKLDLEIQSNNFKKLLEFCGDPHNRRFKDPQGQSRHFGRITGPIEGECVPCGTILQPVMRMTTISQSVLDRHFAMTKTVVNEGQEIEKLTYHGRRVQKFENWVIALQLELIERPLYSQKYFQKFVNTWRITREGEEQHYEKCLSQNCQTCSLELDLQWIEIYNEDQNSKIRITLTQRLSCNSIMVLYYSTCLRHRFLKYIGATSLTFRARVSSTRGALKFTKSHDAGWSWIMHFKDKEKDDDNECKHFNRLIPICSTYRKELTCGQNFALLHANEVYCIRKCSSPSDRFSGNTIENIFSTRIDVKSLGRNNPGLKLLKDHETKLFDFSCPFCGQLKSISEAILGNHIIQDHPDQLIIAQMMLPI